MSLLTKKQAKKLDFLDEINDGFKIPTEVYIHGTDMDFLSEVGADGYSSNYWYGPKDEARQFAEDLAKYFKDAYSKMDKKDPNEFMDFQGMVLFWDNGGNAMVGSIDADNDLPFWSHDDATPPEIKQALIKYPNLIRVMEDSNDNSPYECIYSSLPLEMKRQIAELVTEDSKDYYTQTLESEEKAKKHSP